MQVVYLGLNLMCGLISVMGFLLYPLCAALLRQNVLVDVNVLYLAVGHSMVDISSASSLACGMNSRVVSKSVDSWMRHFLFRRNFPL